MTSKESSIHPSEAASSDRREAGGASRSQPKSFAGGFIGFLAWLDRTDDEAMRQALACGTVLASACVQDFSLSGLQGLDVDGLYRRYEDLRDMVEFCELPARG